MPSEFDQIVHNVASILVAFLMIIVQTNYGEIFATQIRRKACKKTLSMPFLVLIIKLCVHAHARFFSFDISSCATTVIEIDHKRDDEAPTVKRLKVQVLGEHFFIQET